MAILEFGTRGRIDSDRRKGNRTGASRSGATEESDRRLAVLSAVAIAGQLFAPPMLDAQHARERDGEPALRERRGQAEVVRRVGEGDVVRACLQPLDESQCV